MFEKPSRPCDERVTRVGLYPTGGKSNCQPGGEEDKLLQEGAVTSSFTGRKHVPSFPFIQCESTWRSVFAFKMLPRDDTERILEAMLWHVTWLWGRLINETTSQGNENKASPRAETGLPGSGQHVTLTVTQPVFLLSASSCRKHLQNPLYRLELYVVAVTSGHMQRSLWG